MNVPSGTQRAELLRKLLGEISHPDMTWITSSPLIKADPLLQKAISDYAEQAKIALSRETPEAE